VNVGSSRARSATADPRGSRAAGCRRSHWPNATPVARATGGVDWPLPRWRRSSRRPLWAVWRRTRAASHPTRRTVRPDASCASRPARRSVVAMTGPSAQAHAGRDVGRHRASGVRLRLWTAAPTAVALSRWCPRMKSASKASPIPHSGQRTRRTEMRCTTKDSRIMGG